MEMQARRKEALVLLVPGSVSRGMDSAYCTRWTNGTK